MDPPTLCLRLRGGDTVEISAHHFEVADLVALIAITNSSTGHLHIHECRRLTNSEFARLASTAADGRRIVLHQ